MEHPYKFSTMCICDRVRLHVIFVCTIYLRTNEGNILLIIHIYSNPFTVRFRNTVQYFFQILSYKLLARIVFFRSLFWRTHPEQCELRARLQHSATQKTRRTANMFGGLEEKKNEFESWMRAQPPAVRSVADSAQTLTPENCGDLTFSILRLKLG